MTKRNVAMSDGGCENMPALDFVGLGHGTRNRVALSSEVCRIPGGKTLLQTCDLSVVGLFFLGLRSTRLGKIAH